MKKVAYNKGVAIGMAVFAIVIIYFGYTLDQTPAIVGGVLTVLLSILYFINSAVQYDDKTMQIKSPLGLTVGTFNFKKDKFKVEGEKLMINGKKFKISPLMLNKAEYAELLVHIKSSK